MLTLILLLLAACTFSVSPTVPASPPLTVITAVPPTPVPTVPPTPETPYQDARDLFTDVCFDYWEAQVNRVFVIRDAAGLADFYREVNESGLCRFAVTGGDFDFSSRMLIGAVNVGDGCWAYTDPLGLIVDDRAQVVIMQVGWGVEGDCGYRLARPFWVSVPRPPDDYHVEMDFVPLREGG